MEQTDDAARIGAARASSLWVARAAVGIGFAAIVLTLSRFPTDDAFIHLRIARNFAEHGQPYFNLGERVMADSSPLWMAIVAAVFRVFPSASPGSIALVECGVLLALLLVTERFLTRVSGENQALTMLAAVLVCTVGIQAASGLMDSPLALLVLVSAALASASRRATLAGALFALAIVARFECVIPGVFAFAVERDKKRFLTGALPVGLLEAGLLVAAFGTIMPNTITAKAVTFQLTLSESLDMLPAALGIKAGSAALAAAAAAGALALSLRARNDERIRLVPFAGLALALLGIYVVRRAFVFTWYVPLFSFPAGVAALGAALNARRTSRASRVLAFASCAAWLVVAVGAWRSTVNDIRAVLGRDLTISHDMALNSRTVPLASAAAELAARCPEAVVMAPEIGAVGWAFPGRVIDGGGLASPEVLPYFRAGGIVGGRFGHMPARAVADLRPDVVLGMQVLFSDVADKAGRLPGIADYRVATRTWFDASFVGYRVPDTGYFDQSVIVAARGQCAARL